MAVVGKRDIANAQDLCKQLADALGFDGKMVIVTGSQAVDIRDIFTKRVKLQSKVVGEEVL